MDIKKLPNINSFTQPGETSASELYDKCYVADGVIALSGAKHMGVYPGGDAYANFTDTMDAFDMLMVDPETRAELLNARCTVVTREYDDGGDKTLFVDGLQVSGMLDAAKVDRIFSSVLEDRQTFDEKESQTAMTLAALKGLHEKMAELPGATIQPDAIGVAHGEVEFDAAGEPVAYHESEQRYEPTMQWMFHTEVTPEYAATERPFTMATVCAVQVGPDKYAVDVMRADGSHLQPTPTRAKSGIPVPDFASIMPEKTVQEMLRCAQQDSAYGGKRAAVQTNGVLAFRLPVCEADHPTIAGAKYPVPYPDTTAAEADWDAASRPGFGRGSLLPSRLHQFFVGDQSVADAAEKFAADFAAKAEKQKQKQAKKPSELAAGIPDVSQENDGAGKALGE